MSVVTGFSQVAGTWVVAPAEAALAVGPAADDLSWWSNTADDVTVRDCFFDDEFVFNEDGTFQNVLGDATWVEEWQGIAADGCAAPVAPHDGSNDATWVYDDVASTVTLTGVGAYLGIPKVINGAELANPADAPESVTYPVAFDEDKMIVDINFGPGIWRFILQKSDPSNVDEYVESQFKVFPNPANSEITINAEVQIDELIIRDITGKMLIVTQDLNDNQTIDISGFNAGFYLLEARSGNQKSIEKLVVN